VVDADNKSSKVPVFLCDFKDSNFLIDWNFMSLGLILNIGVIWVFLSGIGVVMFFCFRVLNPC
jgi:hypothetical protein